MPERDGATTNLLAFWSAFAAAPGGFVEALPGAELSFSGIPSPLFNAVTLWGQDPEVWAAMHDRAAELIARHGIAMNWRIAPQAMEGGAGAFLAGRGVPHFFTTPAMTLGPADLAPAPLPPGARIEPVAPAARRDWGRLCATAFGFDPPAAAAYATAEAALPSTGETLRFTGFLDGEPVAVASLVMAGGYAGIYAVATLPAARKRGMGAALTAHAVREGARLGATQALLQATEMGFPVYRTLGFKRVFDITIHRQT